jgi:ribose-phosphate pyrophosphokinase
MHSFEFVFSCFYQKLAAFFSYAYIAEWCMKKPDRLLFFTKGYEFLSKDFSSFYNIELGQIVRKTFAEGEQYQRISDSVANTTIFLVGGTDNDTNTMELLDLAMGLVQHDIKSLHVLIPYFGYSTMEREVISGEIVKAKVRAAMLSSIPMAMHPNKFYLLDLHSEGIPYYFDRHQHAMHIYGKAYVKDVLKQYMGNDDFILAATDAGRAKWVESLANDLGVMAAFVYKKRTDTDQTIITGINADVRGKRVAIYDDMIRTGGSLMQAALAYHQAGAQEVIAITTHGLFNNHAIDHITKQGIIQQIFATNSHPNTQTIQHPLVNIHSVVPLFKTIFEQDYAT